MPPHRFSAVLENIHIDHVFVVIVPINLERSALGNGGIVSQNILEFAYLTVVPTHLLPNGGICRASALSIGVLEDAAVSHILGAYRHGCCWSANDRIVVLYCSLLDLIVVGLYLYRYELYSRLVKMTGFKRQASLIIDMTALFLLFNFQ